LGSFVLARFGQATEGGFRRLNSTESEANRGIRVLPENLREKKSAPPHSANVKCVQQMRRARFLLLKTAVLWGSQMACGCVFRLHFSSTFSIHAIPMTISSSVDSLARGRVACASAAEARGRGRGRGQITNYELRITKTASAVTGRARSANAPPCRLRLRRCPVLKVSKEEAIRASARALKAAGVPAAVIAQTTGLPATEIAKL
jgi:hypothetical protein